MLIEEILFALFIAAQLLALLALPRETGEEDRSRPSAS
jgi:hypothetical protein